MAITAGMVKELREMTGAGMMDCKKALTEVRKQSITRVARVMTRYPFSIQLGLSFS